MTDLVTGLSGEGIRGGRDTALSRGDHRAAPQEQVDPSCQGIDGGILRCTDDEIIRTVAVDVSRTRDGPTREGVVAAQLVAITLTHKQVVRRGGRHGWERTQARRQEHIGLTCTGTTVIVVGRHDSNVVATIGV